MSTPLYDRLDELRNTCSWATGEWYSTLAEGVDDLALRVYEGGGGGGDTQLSGSNLEFVDEFEREFTLADTSFVVGTTAPTTATTVKAAVSNMYTSASTPFYDNDIIIIQSLLTAPEHSGEATNTARQYRSGATMISFISKDYPNADGNTLTTRRIFNMASTNLIDYYNSSGTLTRAVASYGLYGALQSPTVGSATANSTTVRASSPALTVRASSSYESAANMKLITSCLWRWKVKVFTADMASTLGGFIRELLNDTMYPPY